MTEPSSAPTGEGLDWHSIGIGALVALVIVIPCAYAIHGASPGQAGILFLGVLIGFGVGGAIAGRNSRDRYLTHGAVAGALSVAVYLVVALVVHAATDDVIRIPALVFTALLGACCGMLGANLGAWRRRSREDADAGGSEGTP